MIIPAGPAEAEVSVKSSRFIAKLHLIDTQEQVKDLVSDLRKEHPGASHVVWAFIWGKDRSIFGYSDDREPKGTAGRPVFEVLKGSGLSNTAITIVRYFGGTKLGTGGLARAYTDSAKAVIEKTETQEQIDMTAMDISFDYSAFERIKLRLSEIGGKVCNESFGEEVSLSVEVPAIEKDNWLKELQDITSGKARIHTV